MKKNAVSMPTQEVLAEIIASIQTIDTHGSVEIFIADGQITQITVRNIKKTSKPHRSSERSVNKVLDKAISIY